MSETANPDLRTIGFRICEVHRDMFINIEGCRKHWVRASDGDEWEVCPKGDACEGLLGCSAQKIYGDRYKHCTDTEHFCQILEQEKRRAAKE